MRNRCQTTLATLLVVGVLVVGVYTVDSVTSESGAGKGTELVEIQLISSDDGKPIENAKLLSTDERESATKTTNKNGKAAFAHSYEYKYLKSFFRNRYEPAIEHEIEIDADGYMPITIDIEKYRLTYSDGYRLPSTIVVELSSN